MAIQGSRPDNRQIVPYLFVRNGDEAIEFYQRAFGAEVLYRSPMPGGNGVFAQLRVGESVVQVATESEQKPCAGGPSSPQTLGGTCVVLETYVDDVDAAFDRAVEAGAAPTMRPCDTFFGDRYSWVTDPYGHLWALAAVKETVAPDEIQRRIDEMMAVGAHG
jgi:PhnB protein